MTCYNKLCMLQQAWIISNQLEMPFNESFCCRRFQMTFRNYIYLINKIAKMILTLSLPTLPPSIQTLDQLDNVAWRFTVKVQCRFRRPLLTRPLAKWDHCPIRVTQSVWQFLFYFNTCIEIYTPYHNTKSNGWFCILPMLLNALWNSRIKHSAILRISYLFKAGSFL